MRRMGIETQQEYVAYMHRDCHICRSEGFEAQTRVLVSLNEHSIVATPNVVDPILLELGEAALSNNTWRALVPAPGNRITISHTPTLDSISWVRAKTYDHRPDASALDSIISDIAAGSYPGTHIAAFLSACTGGWVSLQETIDLTQAILAAGKRLDRGHVPITDKHYVGGLPRNRTTPVVVSIIITTRLTMPKTSSRIITSLAGTADVVETTMPVAPDLEQVRRVIQREDGYFVQGGSLALNPADDMLIRAEHPLDLDSDTQFVTSMLSKKITAGATHSVIDVPVGSTAKVRSDADYKCLKQMLEQAAQALDLHLQVVRTNGTQPVGRGIGPSLETRDIPTVLQCIEHAPEGPSVRAVALAGQLLEFCGHSEPGTGVLVAQRLLDSGAAWAKFRAIHRAQGGLRKPQRARLRKPVLTERDGVVREIDSRRLARVAKLAEAPKAPAVRLELRAKLGDRVERGTPLFTVYIEALGELDRTFDYLEAHPLIDVGDSR